jgi:hypothetical protein
LNLSSGKLVSSLCFPIQLVPLQDGTFDWFTLNRVQTEWPGSSEDGEEEDVPDLSFLPDVMPIPQSRRGMGGMAAMLALSSAAPARVGKHPPRKKQEEGEGNGEGEGAAGAEAEGGAGGGRDGEGDGGGGDGGEAGASEDGVEMAEVKAPRPPRRPRRPREKEAWVRCEHADCCKWRRVPEAGRCTS